MAKIAVDVALLPIERIMDRAIEANRQLLKQCPDKIVLNKENCLPHISLAMGCIDETDIAEIAEILRSIGSSHSPGQLYRNGIQPGLNAGNEKVSLLELKKTKQLQSFHETVMRKLSPFFDIHVKSNPILQ
ncbi:hypothetical protein ACFL5Z_15640, partial [Planctomycetota bacterium]